MAKEKKSSSPKKSDGGLSKYTIISRMGSGSSGQVYLAKRHKHGTYKKTVTTALKIIETNPAREHHVVAELEALSKIGHHPNIVSLRQHGFDAEANSWYLELELARAGDLLHQIERQSMSESVARPLIRDILSAIAFAHSMGVCHRDIKLENMLLVDPLPTSSILVADWGLASCFDLTTPMKKDCGSLHYAAPEILQASSYFGHQADSFSLGILFFAMLTSCFPFFGNTPSERFIDIATRKRLPFPRGLSPEICDLISKLVAFKATDRITAAQALAHPWFGDLAVYDAPAPCSAITASSSSSSLAQSSTEPLPIPVTPTTSTPSSPEHTPSPPKISPPLSSKANSAISRMLKPFTSTRPRSTSWTALQQQQ